MFLTFISISLLLHVLIFTQEVEPIPTWTKEPSNFSFINEGNNLTFQWTYNLDGTLRSAQFLFLPSVTIAVKDANGFAVAPAYVDRTSVIISDSETKVTLFGINRLDSGQYRCTIINNYLSSANSDVEISVQYKPSITHISGHQTVSEGDEVILNCTADGNPRADITWTKVSDGSVVTMPLTITGKQDEGAYRCTADNGVGSPTTETSKILVQNYHPINTNLTTNFSVDDTVVVNTIFNLICSAQANPPAKYRFYKEQESLLNTTTGMNIAVYTTLISKRINQVKFSCTPFNLYGDGQTATLTMTVNYPPEIEYSPSSLVLLEGGGATLFCNATGNPQPSTAWIKQEKDNVLSTSATLSLRNLTRADNGAVYKCKMQNVLGSAEANATTTVLYEPSVPILQCTAPVTEGGNATLLCSAIGNPVPITAWIRATTAEVLSHNMMLVLPAIERNESGSYECFAWNGIGNNSTKSCTIDVLYRPSSSVITVVPSNTTVLRGSTVSLNCSTDANPDAHLYQFYFNDTIIGNSSSGLFNVTVDSDGVYTCVPVNTVGNGHQATISTTAVVAPSVDIDKKAVTVVEGNNIVLFCNASGKPEPTITWTRVGSFEILSNSPSFTVMNVSRPGTPDHMIKFQCTVSNGVESHSSALAIVTVHFSPSGTRDDQNSTVVIGHSASFDCPLDGNPEPTITWYNASGTVISSEKMLFFSLTKSSDTGCYTCSAKNFLGTDNSTHCLVVEMASPTATSSTTSKETSSDFEGTLTVTNKDCKDSSQVEQNICPEISKTYVNGAGIEDCKVKNTRCGSVIVDFALRFNQSVSADEVVSALKAAAQQGKFGSYIVDPESIKQTSSSPTQESSCKESLLKDAECDQPIWVLIEYVPYGDLLGYLRKSRGLNDTYYKAPDIKPQTSLTSQQLMKFAWQIADGMSYLSSRSIIHRDLAARNVLVGEGEICKVTDFGMARDVQQENDIYEKKTTDRRLPVKWTAYEALLHGTFTTKSDVWSYGVVLYEIFTIGGSPYPQKNNKEITNFLERGKRMLKPKHVDEELHQIMLNCWEEKPEARPSFDALTKQLKDKENQHKRLINMHIYENELYEDVDDLNV